MARLSFIATKLQRSFSRRSLCPCLFVGLLIAIGLFLSSITLPALVLHPEREILLAETCHLLQKNGKHWRNLSSNFVEKVYLSTEASRHLYDDHFLSKVFSIDAAKIRKIQIKPEHSDKCVAVKSRRILLNYADGGCCQRSQVRNCESGLRLGGFDICLAFSNWSITDQGFVQRNCDLLSEKLWLFKPYIIFKVLQALDDGDILFYADSGSRFADNIDTSLICHQNEMNQDIVVFSLDHMEKMYTKEDAFVLMNCQTDVCRNSPQRLASFILLRKSAQSLQFVGEWLTYAQDRRILSNDQSLFGWDLFYLYLDRNWRFQTGGHRQDQSVLSLLSKTWGIESWPDPSHYGNLGNVGPSLKAEDDRFAFMRGKYFIFHHRNRD